MSPRRLRPLPPALRASTRSSPRDPFQTIDLDGVGALMQHRASRRAAGASRKPEDRHLRRARRRPGLGQVLPQDRAGLRVAARRSACRSPAWPRRRRRSDARIRASGHPAGVGARVGAAAVDGGRVRCRRATLRRSDTICEAHAAVRRSRRSGRPLRSRPRCTTPRSRRSGSDSLSALRVRAADAAAALREARRLGVAGSTSPCRSRRRSLGPARRDDARGAAHRGGEHDRHRRRRLRGDNTDARGLPAARAARSAARRPRGA